MRGMLAEQLSFMSDKYHVKVFGSLCIFKK